MKSIISLFLIIILYTTPSITQISTACDGHEIELVNLTNTGPPQQSSTYQYSNFNTANVLRSIDGITSGNESDISRTNAEMNPWWEIDLNTSYLLQSIKIWYPEDHYPNGFQNYYILMSEFPFSSHDLNTELSSPFVTHVFVETAVPNGSEIPLDFQEAQYIRLQLDGAGDITVYEIQIPGGDLGEICGNGTDDDCDGLIDCQDSDCAPTIFNVQKTNPSCPICNDGTIRIQAFGENLSYSLDGGVNFQNFPPPTQIREFNNLDEGDYELIIHNGFCQTSYSQNPISLHAPIGTPNGDCGNGDMEEGTFNGWTGGLGDRRDLNGNGDGNDDDGSEAIVINNTDFDVDMIRHTILPSTYNDPNVPPLQLTPPAGGTYFVRLGNTVGGPESERLTYCFDVDNQNADFYFNFAVVLEAPHPESILNPFFQYRMYESGSGNLIGEEVRLTGETGNDFFEIYEPPIGSTITYQGWSCAGYDLSEYIGSNVCLEFITADCARADHFGYAYIDGLCTNLEDQIPTIVLDDNVCPDDEGNYLVDGSNTTGENQYTWTVCELTQSGQEQNCISQDYFNDVGLLNIKEFYPSFDCGNTYRIKLSASNDCTDADEESKDVFISCFDIDYPDYIYCTNESSVPIQGTVNCDAGCVYQWLPNDPFSIDNFNVAFPNVMGFPFGGGSAIYTVTVTDQNGCSLSESIEITKFTEPEVELSFEQVDYCTVKFDARIRTNFPQNSLLVELENLTTGDIFENPTINYVGETGTGVDNSMYDAIFELGEGEFIANSIYEIRVKLNDAYKPNILRDSDCTATDQIDIGDVYFFGPLNNLLFTNFVSPNGDGVNDISVVNGSGVCEGCFHAYNATEFEFTVYQRWGGTNTIMHEQIGLATLENGFIQNAIQWDGTNLNGNVVQNGVYEATLEIRNCFSSPTEDDGITVSINDHTISYNPNGVYLFKWFIAKVE